MKNLTSIFFEHYNSWMEISDSFALKQSIQTLVNNSSIKETDKRKIFRDLGQLESRLSLQSYLTNSMLKYQGMGVL
jgi:hypothetical protein